MPIGVIAHSPVPDHAIPHQDVAHLAECSLRWAVLRLEFGPHFRSRKSTIGVGFPLLEPEVEVTARPILRGPGLGGLRDERDERGPEAAKLIDYTVQPLV